MMLNAQYLGWKMSGGDKVPVSLTSHQLVDPHDPANWMSEESARTLIGGGVSLAYGFTADDPYFFIDLDKCLEGGAWSPLALEICAMFPGAFMEVSQSGTGLHIIARGVAIPHRCKNVALHIELYTEKRFIALTETHATGSVEVDHTVALAALVDKYFKPEESHGGVDGWTDAPCAEWDGWADDHSLIEAAMRSKSVSSFFGAKASFADLWTCDVDALAAAFPTSTDGQAYDASSADAALASHLSFWTGRDCERIKRLMLQSRLAREKWEREDYINTTILKASRVGKSVHVRQRAATRDSEAGEPVPEGRGLHMTTTDQVEYFKGCTFVLDVHRVHSARHGGMMLKPDQFKSAYAGHKFALDDMNSAPTKNAWEAFVESRANPPRRAASAIFAPQEAPGALIMRDGRALLNTYLPAKIDRRPGEVSLFLRHLALLFPVERDREIIKAYMAFVVQHPGVRARWCPLIQGTQGNGKTLLSQVVANAVGQQYSHCPNPRALAGRFNAWIPECLFGYIEDVYAPGERNEIAEALKPMITGDYIDVEPKGQDSRTCMIWLNFMINSNYKDAIQKTEGDRRFAPFYTPQQSRADVERDMPGDYFKQMYDWLEKEGYAAIADWLHTYPIPVELDPSKGCNRAPLTSSTIEAIEVGQGSAEGEILEAVEAGLVGFRGGWVSSHYLDALLDDAGMSRRLPRNRRRDALCQLGYIPHPGLPGGRVHNVVTPDQAKPVLFIKKGHISCGLPGVAAARAYTDCQNGAITRGLSFGTS